MNTDSAATSPRLSPATAGSTPSAAGASAGPQPFFRSAVLGALAGMKRGHLRIELPDGGTAHFGEGTTAPNSVLAIARPEVRVSAQAAILVRRERFFKRCVLQGDIGFAEAYLDGDWDSPDLTAVVAWFILNVENAPTLSGSAKAKSAALNLLRFADRLGHLLRGNTRLGSRRNISAHYDLSNAFFSIFLDPTFMYSAAKWTRADMTLEEAQVEKNEALCRKLRLNASDHVLEIGSGWGGWAIQAAQNYGCRVTTVTLSRQQFELATERVARAGLGQRVKVEFRDYRDLRGQFDKIVSIEMLEAVGHRHLPRFCETVNRTLAPNGLLALQFITCPDSRYDAFRRGVDFIQKHVFPGSLLLSLNRVNDHLSKAGGFLLHGVEDLGPDYAITLRKWHEAFRGRLGEVRALGFDERFIRKWSYYLCYCEAAFALRNISVVQTLHTRPNNLSL